MKKILCFIIAVLFTTSVYAADVKLVKEKSPFFAFFDLFKGKEEVLSAAAAQEGKPLSAENGRLNVAKKTSAEGRLSFSSEQYTDVTFVISQLPEKGEITLTDNKKGTFIYTPSPTAEGQDSFGFVVSSGEISDTGTVAITIGDEPQKETVKKAVKTDGFVYEDMYNHWGQYSAIQLANKNILKGMEIRGKYYFYPDTLLTRADFIVLLMSSLDIDVTSAREIANPFADAAEIPAWANLYAKAAYDAGIVSGALENGKLYFRPNDILTRIEIIKILDKTIKPDTVSMNKSGYADMYLVPDWGKEAVQNMTDYGILNGYDDNTIRPYVKINKAMAAEFILQVLNYKEENPVMMKQIYSKMSR